MSSSAHQSGDSNSVTFSKVLPDTYVVSFTDYSSDEATNTAQAESYRQQFKAIASAHPDQKINVINDTSAVSSKVTGLSNKARHIYTELYKHPQMGKVAMVGLSSWLKAFVATIAPLAGRSADTAFFDTRDKALAWITEESTP